VTTQAPLSRVGMSCHISGRDNTDALTTDPATGNDLVCDDDTWTVSEPLVGTVESGSSCKPSQKGAFARSSYGYRVSCWDVGLPAEYIWIRSNY
jgi:hypothetical protein